MRPIDTLARQMAEAFALPSPAVSAEPFGTGHINDTYLLRTAEGEPFILQRISPVAFPDAEKVMENVARVTAFLKERIRRRGGDPAREAMSLVPALSGATHALDPDGGCWRVYLFIRGAVSHELPDSPAMLAEAGRAFGRFQRDLDGFPAETLHETIPAFHDTPRRIAAFWESVRRDGAGRLDGARAETDMILERADRAGLLTDALRSGALPLRVTHNDTKLNNILMDRETGRAVCVADLDTVMPGLIAWDFGDAVRFGANTAAEDERDLSRVSLSMEMFRAFTEGYLDGAGAMLTAAELDSLTDGCWMMTYELASRFLADHLDGDRYFRVARPGHNLDRARCQLALLKDIERHTDAMRAAVRKAAGRNSDA